MNEQERAKSDEADLARCNNWFQYHLPRGNQAERYGDLRAKAGEFAKVIVNYCPPGADRTAALRKLRECVFTANAAIACDEVEYDDDRYQRPLV